MLMLRRARTLAVMATVFVGASGWVCGPASSGLHRRRSSVAAGLPLDKGKSKGRRGRVKGDPARQGFFPSQKAEEQKDSGVKKAPKKAPPSMVEKKVQAKPIQTKPRNALGRLRKGDLRIEDLEAVVLAKWGPGGTAASQKFDDDDEDDDDEDDEEDDEETQPLATAPTPPPAQLAGWGFEAEAPFLGGFIVRPPEKEVEKPVKKAEKKEFLKKEKIVEEEKPVVKAVRRPAGVRVLSPASVKKQSSSEETSSDDEEASSEASSEDAELPTFESLGVDDATAALLKADGIARPTPVQSAALANALNDDAPLDTLLRAPTGSGKTLAYLLPALLSVDPELAKPQLLILSPGRELAQQIAGVVTAYGGPDLECLALCGGANPKRQLERLRKQKPRVVVGTPGRLAELALSTSALKLSEIKWCILDEADALAKPPFLDDVEAIVSALPSRGTRLVFASATVDDLIDSKSDSFLAERARDAALVEAASLSAFSPLAPKVAHAKLLVESRYDLLDALRRVLRSSSPKVDAAVIFVNDAEGAVKLCDQLQERHGIRATPLAGDSDGPERKAAIQSLNRPRRRQKASADLDPTVVVATELGARGLDARRVSHVINYEHLPSTPSHYAHRAGRTGRGPEGEGVVVTIVPKLNERILDNIAKTLKVDLHAVEARDGELRILDDEDATIIEEAGGPASKF